VDHGLEKYIQSVISQVQRREQGATGKMAEMVGILVTVYAAGRLGATDLRQLRDDAMVGITNAALRLNRPPPDGHAWVYKRIDRLATGRARFVADDRDRAADTFGRLMPSRAVAAHGLEVAVSFRSFDVVGGDFFDHSVTKTDALIAFGDVASKGMASAEWAAYLLAQFRMLSQRIRDPHTLTRRLDTLFKSATGPAEYAAITISRWVPERQTLTVANAGYPRPHLVRRGLVRQIGGEGNPVGLMQRPKFSVTAERAEFGDVILMASDGISEQTNNSGRDFNVGNLARRLSIDPNDSAEALVEQAWHLFEAATCRRPRKDDQTLGVLRFM
jgi:sigma-B regulation protein RsbU (phosphoserine phosphatase)